MIQGLTPADWCAARRVGFEGVGLMHGKFCLASVHGERHSRENILSWHVVNVSLENDSRRLNDLDKLAVERIILAVLSAYDEAKYAARTKAHLAFRQSASLRHKPTRQVLGLGPGFEYEVSWRIEDTHDREFLFPDVDEIIILILGV
jgi:hypothetical protein